MDNEIRKIKVFAIDDYGNGFVTLLGEFKDYEDIRIQTGAFSKDTVIELEEYWIGED